MTFNLDEIGRKFTSVPFKILFPTGTQACPKSRTNEDCGIQCNIANLPPLTLLHLPHKGSAKGDGENSPEPLPEEEPFEDAEVDDEDYNPYQDSEDEEDQPDEKIKGRDKLFIFLPFSCLLLFC